METPEPKDYGYIAVIIAAIIGWITTLLKRKDLYKYLPKSASAKMIEFLKEQLDRKDTQLAQKSGELAEARKENTDLIKSLVRRKNPVSDKESNS